MVRGVGVVAVPVRPVVAVRVRSVLPAAGGVREADLGRVFSRKLLSEEALQLPEPSPRAASSRALAARCGGDASDGGAPLVGKVCGVWRVGAADRGGAADRSPNAGRQLGAQGQVIGRVVVECHGEGDGGFWRRRRGGTTQRAGGRIGLLLGARGPAAGGVEDR